MAVMVRRRRGFTQCGMRLYPIFKERSNWRGWEEKAGQPSHHMSARRHLTTVSVQIFKPLLCNG